MSEMAAARAEMSSKEKLAPKFRALAKSVVKNKLSSFADVVQAIASYDKNGRIQLGFDDDDDQYDITALQQHDRVVQAAEPQQAPIRTDGSRIPKMNICIMIVGTRGDVQPFLGIAKRLQRDGHRVRLATHAVYRDFVMEHDVEFYPLGGDPKELAAYMVKTGGHLIPVKLETIRQDVPRNMQMIEEILNSTWPAVSAPDPDGKGKGIPGKPFQAHAIISNPVTYGHIHVAERLGAPLHIMFPQPWVPTVEFPHPLSNLPYSGKRQKRNYLSYKLVDLLMWQGTESMVNEFRTQVLGLRKIRKGDGGRDMLLDLAIPHAFMWSPKLVSKPADWGAIYDVIGTVLLKEAGSNYTPTPELETFLGTDGGPIFVGFGSMVLLDPLGTTKMIIEAAKQAKVRVLIQSSWSDMSGDLDVPDNVFFLGNCPHDWLMPRVSAVVHHGGAGTTAAGLLAGKPTFIVPFFGDQPFWGRAVVQARVGVEPCPIGELTVDKLRTAFERLLDPELRANALKLGDEMSKEDGVEGAVQCFYKHLPVDKMLCDIDGHQIATKWTVKDKLKLCDECEYVISSRPDSVLEDFINYHCVDYSARGPNSSREGISSGAGAFVHELGSGVKDVFLKPAQGYRNEGAKGAVIGLAKGVGGLFIRPIRGAAIFADHVATGHYNKHRGADERKRGTVLLDKKGGLFNTLDGQTVAPDAHLATMRPDETSHLSQRHKTDHNQVSIHISDAEKHELEAKFHELMAKRRVDNEAGDDQFRVEAVSQDDEFDDSVATKITVNSATYNQRGELDIQFSGVNNDPLPEEKMIKLRAIAEEESRFQTSRLEKARTTTIPRMNICMMTSGTWSDSIQQFVAIGLRLKRDGHRVRIATNEKFRKRITDAGLEFYPLGGHATTIGKFLLYKYEQQNCERRGSLGGSGRVFSRLSISRDEFPELEDLKSLVFSLWPACVDPDPLLPGLQFRADAIIAHPLLFGQTIVAERLGVPLHCVGTTPVSRTQAFPHLMSANVTLHRPYRYAPTNAATFDVVDTLLWDGMRDVLDDFRSSLGLSGRSTSRNLLMEWRIPHTYLWNSHLLPKPLDWGSEISIAGYVAMDSTSSDRLTEASLASFVADNTTPVIYFGFARGEWEPRRITTLINEIENAASQVGVRVIFQILEESEERDLYRSKTLIEVSSSTPHSVVVVHVAAAVHWGDGSITSTCLAAGLPSCAIARNVTQRLWGQAIALSGVGADPLEVDTLNASNLVHVFECLLDPRVVTAAKELSTTFSSEAAVEQTINSFYANLPLDGMVCDLDPTRIARIYDAANELKLSYEAQLVVQAITTDDPSLADLKYKPLKYSLNHPPRFSLRQLDAQALATSEMHSHERLPQFSYDVTELLGPGRGLSGVGLPAKTRALLSRHKSMAVNVIEAPSFWPSPEVKKARTTEINAAYEKLLKSHRY